MVNYSLITFFQGQMNSTQKLIDFIRVQELERQSAFQ